MPHEWELYRTLRLAALKEAPYAFGSTYRGEVRSTEDQWRQRLEDRTRFVAEVDGEPAGTVSGGDSATKETAAMTAMWVDPRFRRRGVGDLLVRTVVDWAKTSGYREMYLWVTKVNHNAERLYQRKGFVRTGASQEIRPGELEYEMFLRL